MNALIINTSPVKTGATARIAELVEGYISGAHDVRSICIDDYDIAFCRGCRACHGTAKCVLEEDGTLRIIAELERADIIICIAPSYWADVPGQFKAFIDRCTPWCNTHEPYATIGSGKKGYTIALRTGPGMHECERLISTIEHFYGHMEIECCGALGLTSLEYREQVEERRAEIEEFCKRITA